MCQRWLALHTSDRGRNISLRPAPQHTLGLEARGRPSTPTTAHLVSDAPPLAIGSSPATPPSVAPRRRIAAPAPSARREHAHRQLREGRRHGIPIGINQARVWAAEEALQRLGCFCLRHRACSQDLHRAQHSSPPIPRWACGFCGDRQKCGWAHLDGRRAELTRGQRRRRVGGREV